MLSHCLHKLQDILFPRKCYLCKKSGDVLCVECTLSLDEPLDTPHAWITSCFSYRDARVKKIIHAIKFFNRRDLAVPLAQKMASKLSPSPRSVLVPIPMPRGRRLLRGYNQSLVLAEEVSKASGIPLIKNMLIRTKRSKRQVTHTTRSERLKQQHTTMETLGSLAGKDVILIDDVTTTGATLLEARRALTNAEALSVRAVTVAH